MCKRNHKNCYGKLFPDILHPNADRVAAGKVFSLKLSRAGGMFVCQQRVAVNIEEWDDCLECPEFEHCYKLCMGRAALEAAIKG